MSLLDGSLWLSLSAERVNARTKADGGYPPYNIELIPGSDGGPEVLRITLAVAGFGLDELDVSIEDGQLLIRGAKHDEGTRDYLHRGIAARQFKRTFALADGVEVRKAELHDGLLAIELERPHREKRVLKVGIVPAG
ncbi:MAG: Hsp20 family protein [Methyloceanibacter sp.]|uniref:Hsp20 family protein n=1 Tax=Methyloceanibacter sp. TaxID=1965321 RepID=UPI003D6D3D0D